MFDTLRGNYFNKNTYCINICKNEIYICNYKKINKLTEKEAELEITQNILSICGKDLKVQKMIKGEILITGMIKKLEYLNYD